MSNSEETVCVQELYTQCMEKCKEAVLRVSGLFVVMMHQRMLHASAVLLHPLTLWECINPSDM